MSNNGIKHPGSEYKFRNFLALKIAIAILFFTSISACQKKDDEIWKEEVRLSNGQMIIVDRKNKYSGSGDLTQNRGPLVWSELSFSYKGKGYRWGARGVWPVALQSNPEDKILIVSKIVYGWACQERGKPESAYVVFAELQDGWREISVREIDKNVEFNLADDSASSEPGRDKGKPRSYVKETDEKFKDSQYEPYRHIVPNLPPPGC